MEKSEEIERVPKATMGPGRGKKNVPRVEHSFNGRGATGIAMPDIDKVDRDALTRCVKVMMSDPDRREHIEYMMSDRSWVDAAITAAYYCQSMSLNLTPWQEPPCVASEGGPDRDPQAQALLCRLLDKGLSRFEPDPIAALGRRKKRA